MKIIKKISLVFALFAALLNLHGAQLDASFCGPKYGALYSRLKFNDGLYTDLSLCRFIYKYIYRVGDCYFYYHISSFSDFIMNTGTLEEYDIDFPDNIWFHFMCPILDEGIFFIGNFEMFNLLYPSMGFLKNGNKILVSPNESDEYNVYYFKDISTNGSADACGAQIENFCGNIIYKNYLSHVFIDGLYYATYVLSKIDQIDPKIIMKYYDLEAYRIVYFNKTGIWLDSSECLELAKRKDDASFDNEEFKESISICKIARSTLNRLSGRWQVEKSDDTGKVHIENVISQFGYTCGIFPEKSGANRNAISIKFIGYDFKGNMRIRIIDLKFKRVKGFIRCDVERSYFITSIFNFSNTNIIWVNAGQKDKMLKWEISPDFTEIKEYRKDGGEWELYSTMKKLPSEN